MVTNVYASARFTIQLICKNACIATILVTMIKNVIKARVWLQNKKKSKQKFWNIHGGDQGSSWGAVPLDFSLTSFLGHPVYQKRKENLRSKNSMCSEVLCDFYGGCKRDEKHTIDVISNVYELVFKDH